MDDFLRDVVMCFLHGAIQPLLYKMRRRGLRAAAALSRSTSARLTSSASTEVVWCGGLAAASS